MDRRGLGLLSAFALGAAAGVIASPPSARFALAVRVRERSALLLDMARERMANWAAAYPDLFDSIADMTAAVLQAVRMPWSDSPTERLKSAFAAHSSLCQRAIWVDAFGSTLLLHGLVEDDEEWRHADMLARQMSPDGSVRNLLQVRRAAETE
jgi:hypothetical protein